MGVLDPSRAAEFKARLRERASQLRREIQHTLERSSDETHVRVAEQVRDAEDDAFAHLVVDLNFAEIERDVDELRRIDAALQRITAGVYGFCVDCGEEIPEERLRAEPTALRDVRCQERYEKTHATGNTPSL